MLARVKGYARRWPGYRRLQDAYYGGRGLLETHLLGTGLQAWLWRRRPGITGADFEVAVRHPHRELLASRVARHKPDSILEFGCNSGPNLEVLARRFPTARLIGIDISARAVEAGRGRLLERGLANVRLEQGSVSSLGAFPDRSVDVVFTDAVVLYIGPDLIDRLVAELLRIGAKAVIFNEWHAKGATRGVYHYAHWLYDYRALVARHDSNARVTVTKPPPGLWGGAGWETYGAMIDVEPGR